MLNCDQPVGVFVVVNLHVLQLDSEFLAVFLVDWRLGKFVVPVRISLFHLGLEQLILAFRELSFLLFSFLLLLGLTELLLRRFGELRQEPVASPQPVLKPELLVHLTKRSHED